MQVHKFAECHDKKFDLGKGEKATEVTYIEEEKVALADGIGWEIVKHCYNAGLLAVLEARWSEQGSPCRARPK